MRNYLTPQHHVNVLSLVEQLPPKRVQGKKFLASLGTGAGGGFGGWGGKFPFAAYMFFQRNFLLQYQRSHFDSINQYQLWSGMASLLKLFY